MHLSDFKILFQKNNASSADVQVVPTYIWSLSNHSESNDHCSVPVVIHPYNQLQDTAVSPTYLPSPTLSPHMV